MIRQEIIRAGRNCKLINYKSINKKPINKIKLEKIKKTQSLRKLARLGFECYVTKNYRDSKITLRDASALLKLSLSETIDLLSDLGVKGNIRSSDVLASYDSLASLD